MGKPWSALLVAGIQAASWLVQLGAAWAALQAFHLGGVGLRGAALVLVLTNLIGLVPITPGNLGTFQAAAAAALAVSGVAAGPAVAFALGLQACSCRGVVAGLVSLSLQDLTLADLRGKSRKAAALLAHGEAVRPARMEDRLPSDAPGARLGRRKVGQEQRLGQHAARELGQVDALVGSVDPAPRLFFGPQRIISAPGTALRKAATRGMLPPSPRRTTGRPNASPSARVAALKAGPSVRARNPSPPPASAISSRTFQGAAARRWAATAAVAAAGSCPGARRTLTMARALGTTALAAPSTAGASSPMTVIAGLAQRRSARLPVPVRATPGSTPASRRKASSSTGVPS